MRTECDASNHFCVKWQVHVCPQRAFEECRDLACQAPNNPVPMERVRNVLCGLFNHLLNYSSHVTSDTIDTAESPTQPLLVISEYRRVSSLLHLPPRTREALGIQASRKVSYRAVGGHSMSGTAIDLPSLLDRCLSPGGRHLLFSQLLSPSTDADEINGALDMVQWIHEHSTSLNASNSLESSGVFQWRADTSNSVTKRIESIVPHMVRLGDLNKTLRTCTQGLQQSSPKVWKKLCEQLSAWGHCLGGLLGLCELEGCPFTQMVDSYNLTPSMIDAVQTELAFIRRVLQLPESSSGAGDDGVSSHSQDAQLLPGYMDASALFVARDASDDLTELWSSFRALSASISDAAESRGEALQQKVFGKNLTAFQAPAGAEHTDMNKEPSVMLINHKYFGACWTIKRHSSVPLGPDLTAEALESCLAFDNIHIELLASFEDGPEICFTDAFSEAANRELRAVCHAILQEQAAVHDRISVRLQAVHPSIESGLLAMNWLDVAYAFATISIECAYVRPTIVVDSPGQSVLDIQDGRHPIQELLVPQFFPNTITLSSDLPAARPGDTGAAADDSTQAQHGSCLIIAGANSSGKSVLLKQTGLLQVLAQAGSFVPAKAATLSPSSGIYTRISTSDK